jgi:hypothetical protein
MYVGPWALGSYQTARREAALFHMPSVVASTPIITYLRMATAWKPLSVILFRFASLRFASFLESGSLWLRFTFFNQWLERSHPPRQALTPTLHCALGDSASSPKRSANYLGF